MKQASPFGAFPEKEKRGRRLKQRGCRRFDLRTDKILRIIRRFPGRTMCGFATNYQKKKKKEKHLISFTSKTERFG